MDSLRDLVSINYGPGKWQNKVVLGISWGTLLDK